MQASRLLLTSFLVVAAACGGSDSACDPTATGTICTIAGTGEAGLDRDDEGHPATDAQLYQPQDSLAAPDGTLYFIDWNNHLIRKVTPDGTLEHVAGVGELPDGSEPPPTGEHLNHPTGLTFTPDGGGMVIAAWHNSRVRTLDLATGVVAETGGDGRRANFGDEGPALTASLDLPSSIAFGADGDLFIMDQANQSIRRIDGDGMIHRFAGWCVVSEAGVPEPTDVEPVQCPMGSGKWAKGDPATVCTRPCNLGYAATDDLLTLRMSQAPGQDAPPGGRISFDGQGRLVFADTNNHLIRRIDLEAGTVEVVAGTAPVDGEAQGGASGDGGPATSARLNHPVDVEIADDGTIYFTDVDNHAVRKVDPAGTISTVVGTLGQSGFAGDGDAPATALLSRPFGIELAGSQLFVADSGNHRVRAVNL